MKLIDQMIPKKTDKQYNVSVSASRSGARQISFVLFETDLESTERDLVRGNYPNCFTAAGCVTAADTGVPECSGCKDSSEDT